VIGGDNVDAVLTGELVDAEDLPFSEVIPIVRRHTISFDGATGEADPAAYAILAGAVAVASWARLTLSVLVHEVNGLSSTALVTIFARPVSVTPDEPDVTFRDPASFSTAVISATTPNGTSFVVALSAAAFIEVAVECRQGGVSATGPQSVTFSVYLSCRRGLVPDIEVLPPAECTTLLAEQCLRLLPRTDYSFDVRANQSQEIILATAIDVSPFSESLLVVREHEKSGWAAGVFGLVLVRSVSVLPEEPDVVFRGPPVTALALHAASTSPVGTTLVVPSGAGPMVEIVLQWQQGSVEAAGPQLLSLSVDLIRSLQRLG
jgi:hypothetical protein